MHCFLYILYLTCLTSIVQAQSNYQLSQFRVIPNTNIQGQHGTTQGIDIQFKCTPYVLSIPTQQFSVEIKNNGQMIAAKSIDFSYQCSDSLAYWIDSLGMDSFNLDTLLHIYIPYREIDIEEGLHDVSLMIWIKGQGLPIYNRAYRLKQVKIYDLFLDLKAAAIFPDTNANPISLGYSVPDPKWLVNISSDLTLHGVKNKNSLKTKSQTFSTAISNYDSLSVCIYNTDPTAYQYLGCFQIEHGNSDFYKDYQNVHTNQIKSANFEVKKIERKPASTNFHVIENMNYKGIKGIQVDFQYSLPLSYKRKHIRIHITDKKQARLENILEITGQRTVQGNRIIGKYSYFIAYYNLQGSQAIQLKLTGNDFLIQQHISDSLDIAKTIEALQVQQSVGYQHQGISGILYQIDFNIPEIPSQAQLKLSFPTLPDKTIAELFYWNAIHPNKVYKGVEPKIPSLNQQTIFIFLPYFVAPSTIQLAPRLSIEAIDVPSIKLATFDTKNYARPNSLNDIRIEATSHKEILFTGISGQLFQFKTNIPDYYHSKGIFQIQILENGKPIQEGFFINENAEQNLQFPIHNQKDIRVFIPYRIMQEGAHYSVTLQAQGANFTLSESRTESYNYSQTKVETIGFYLQELYSKEWQQVVYAIQVRNNKNPNSTYPDLGYEVILQDTVGSKYKPSIPNAIHFSAALNDEIIITIKSPTQTNQQALRFSTSIATMRAEKNLLQLKNQSAVKKATFKMIDQN